MVKQEIVVIRYGHRDVRDYRVTTHCALVSRAFGAKEIIVCGERYESISKTVNDVTKRWGGPFKVSFAENWRSAVSGLKKKDFILVNLTMYGQAVENVDKEISKNTKIAILIGSQKVERAVYEKADYNVGVTQQPHSEIAALAVFMDRVQEGKELGKVFTKADRRIEPQARGKRVISLKGVREK